MIQSSTEFIPDASIMKKNSDNYTPDASIMIKNLESSGKGLPENIQELIDNSIDANSTECHIHLRSSRGENTYFTGITIIDNGDGFASRGHSEIDCQTSRHRQVDHTQDGVNRGSGPFPKVGPGGVR